MKLNAVAVVASDIAKSKLFYEILGFEFEKGEPDASHIESVNQATKLMLDDVAMITSVTGHAPTPASYSCFALEFETVEELNEKAKMLVEKGFTVEKEPWDAFWGQRYCIAKDPFGNFVDLYAKLK